MLKHRQLTLTLSEDTARALGGTSTSVPVDHRYALPREIGKSKEPVLELPSLHESDGDGHLGAGHHKSHTMSSRGSLGSAPTRPGPRYH